MVDALGPFAVALAAIALLAPLSRVDVQEAVRTTTTTTAVVSCHCHVSLPEGPKWCQPGVAVAFGVFVFIVGVIFGLVCGQFSGSRATPRGKGQLYLTGG